MASPNPDPAPSTAAGNDDTTPRHASRLISFRLDSSSVARRLENTEEKDRYPKLSTLYQALEQKFHELEARNIELQNDNDEALVQYQGAIEQQNRAQTTLEAALVAEKAAVAKQNEMAMKFFDLQNRSTPSMEAAVPRKSARMPDAPMFSDGKEVRYEAWATTIRQKLLANADHYPEPVHRKLYVQSRCEGKAQLHIAPRMDEASTRPYEDAEDILSHLRSVFANPNRKAEAYSAYHQLTMKPRDGFTDFLAEFLQLAEEACVVRENLKRDLYLKLPNLLQTQMMLAVNQSHVTFDNFTEQCQSISHEIMLQQHRSTDRRNHRGGTVGGSARTTTAHTALNTSGTSQPTTARVKREGFTPARMTDAERNKLVSEGKCFYCKEPGHISLQCPKKTTTTPAAVATASTKPKETVVTPDPRIVELEGSDDEQGKEYA
ncbi:uncharacterized protein N7515_003051 [Penicillium bovifimosum]|uniref:CCHC-type domain-containing protein n=1 Tax=Penicillium bovifimosum TaxID=126998 RepID=A0A9W9HCX5_9EURO|nr:uncharacterized protein N7515_008439 [Penicillium bovifimosum]XP_056525908.1 uncharacterized protein N7515_003051 [Penicillium bovifimosum]KAJ5124614.1 hypothetical protein N7515_008439 [Penicillium bovifimosum]KAJ5144264.1 hypothetical protein N7515_003051 [Penicillium bovifimosum]